MQQNEAIETLKNLSYKPGWTFDAKTIEEIAMEAGGPFEVEMAKRVLGDSFATTLAFRLDFETVDTDREYAREGYPKAKSLGQSVPFNAVDFKDADALRFAVFELIMQLELHEAREFFRCKDQDYNAPFHPHREEGNALWERCNDEAN